MRSLISFHLIWLMALFFAGCFTQPVPEPTLTERLQMSLDSLKAADSCYLASELGYRVCPDINPPGPPD